MVSPLAVTVKDPPATPGPDQPVAGSLRLTECPAGIPAKTNRREIPVLPPALEYSGISATEISLPS